MTSDKASFDRLQSQYATEGGTRAVFSSKVADYVASRPDYPGALYDALARLGLLAAGQTVADVGAGTGLLTQGLLQRGCEVVAVEPNAAMRAAADERLARYTNYRSVDGCAEAMPLADASVDLVTAAQAFHWFEVDAARRECLRVLRPGGQVALIWNDRVLADTLHTALDEVFTVYGGEKRRALLAHEDRTNVPLFFGSGAYRELAWPHHHQLGEQALLSLVYSRSYIPARGTPAGAEVEHAVRRLFEQHAVAGAVTARYRTVAIVGRPAV